MTFKKMSVALLTVCFALAGALPGTADLIETGTPYDDGVNSAWVGTTPFVAPENPNLAGSVDWAVFGPGDFPFSGYSPPSNEYSYVYQVFSTGSDFITSYSVPVINPAGNAGSFSDSGNGITGVAPSLIEITGIPGSVYWQFSPGIVQLGNSEGLVFSSPKRPRALYSLVVNGGTFATAVPVPSPSAEPIPEPCTFILLVMGLGVLCFARFFRSSTR